MHGALTHASLCHAVACTLILQHKETDTHCAGPLHTLASLSRNTEPGRGGSTAQHSCGSGACRLARTRPRYLGLQCGSTTSLRLTRTSRGGGESRTARPVWAQAQPATRFWIYNRARELGSCAWLPELPLSWPIGAAGCLTHWLDCAARRNRRSLRSPSPDQPRNSQPKHAPSSRRLWRSNSPGRARCTWPERAEHGGQRCGGLPSGRLAAFPLAAGCPAPCPRGGGGGSSRLCCRHSW